jgi:hypothetical protein
MVSFPPAGKRGETQGRILARMIAARMNNEHGGMIVTGMKKCERNE